jgi:hypothetical protein
VSWSTVEQSTHARFDDVICTTGTSYSVALVVPVPSQERHSCGCSMIGAPGQRRKTGFYMHPKATQGPSMGTPLRSDVVVMTPRQRGPSQSIRSPLKGAAPRRSPQVQDARSGSRTSVLSALGGSHEGSRSASDRGQDRRNRRLYGDTAPCWSCQHLPDALLCRHYHRCVASWPHQPDKQDSIVQPTAPLLERKPPSTG